MWWYVILGVLGLIAAFYLAVPLVIWKTFCIEETPTIQRIDPASLPLPSDVQQHLDSVDTELQELGFESRATLLLPSAVPNVISMLRVFVNPASKVSAMANSMIATVKTDAGDQVQHKPYVEFTTRYEDGKVFNTLNSTAGSSFPPKPQTLTTRVSWLQNATLLHMIHDMIATRRSGGARRVLRLDESFGGDEIAFLQACMKEELQHAAKCGYVWLGPGDTAYRATLRGAYLMTLKELPPFKQLFARRERRRAEKRMEDVGISVKKAARSWNANEAGGTG